MKTIINIGKCGITAILALCILLGMVGTCMNVSATEEIATVVTDEATVVSTETIIILTEETTVTPKEATVKVTRTASELIPMMAQSTAVCGSALRKRILSLSLVSRMRARGIG